MQIRWIEDFLTLTDARAFSRAAQRRNVSQPTFTRHIQALENWLGVELIDRGARGVQLTAAGRIFRGFAADMLSRTYDMRTVLRGQSPVSGDTVRFSVSHTLSLTFFPDWLRRLKEALGNVVARVGAVNVSDGARALTEGATDLLIVYHHPHLPVLLDPGEFPHLVLATERMLPFSAPRDDGRPKNKLPRPAGSSGAVSRRFLRHIPGACGGDDPARCRQRCHFDRSFDTQMAETLKAMIVAGHGLGWLPESCVGRDATVRRLVPAGPAQWTCSLEVRLHRSAENSNPMVERIWGLLNKGAVER